MKIYDARGRLLRPTEDGLHVGDTFLWCPPMMAALRLPTEIVLAEPLRVQREFDETTADAEREVEWLRRRYAGAGGRGAECETSGNAR